MRAVYKELGKGTPPARLLELEDLVNNTNWKSFNTGFDTLDEFADSIIGVSKSGGHKKALLRIYLSNVDDVAKNADAILGDKSVKKSFIGRDKHNRVTPNR